MFCPNCGVKVNSLDVCPICGVNLEALQKYSLVKETPPKNNYANVAVFARSLNLRKRSKDVNDFIRVQKDYLARQKAIAEEIKGKEEALAKQKRLLEEKQAELEKSKEEKQNRLERNEEPQSKFTPLAKIEPQKVAVQTNVARSQYADSNQSSQIVTSQTSTSIFQPQTQPVQRVDTAPQTISQNTINQNSFPEQRSNTQQRPQNIQSVNQPKAQQRSSQTQPQPQQNPAQNYVPERVTAIDDFDIPTINTDSNATQYGREIPMGDAVAVSEKADNLAKENGKRINKLSADEKKRKREKRKFFGILSLVISILCVFVIAFILIQKYSTSASDLFVNIRLFMDHYGYYLVWGLIGGGALAIIFALIQIMIGGKKFSWIVFLVVLVLVGGCIGYLYGTNNLIEPAKKLVKFITNGFKE